jgi:hypothetical protein
MRVGERVAARSAKADNYYFALSKDHRYIGYEVTVAVLVAELHKDYLKTITVKVTVLVLVPAAEKVWANFAADVIEAALDAIVLNPFPPVR